MRRSGVSYYVNKLSHCHSTHFGIADHIAFHLMSPRDLVTTVQPSEVVPDAKIMTALAYQADPASVDLASIAVLRTTIA